MTGSRGMLPALLFFPMSTWEIKKERVWTWQLFVCKYVHRAGNTPQDTVTGSSLLRVHLVTILSWHLHNVCSRPVTPRFIENFSDLSKVAGEV